MTVYREYLEKELSTLTQIPVLTLQNINTVSSNIIAHIVAENKEKGLNSIDIDIGYGILKIQFIEDAVTYKFIPSAKLQNAVLLACTNGVSELESHAEHSLAQRVKERYRELL